MIFHEPAEVFPASVPLAITLTPSGRSVISQDSPIGFGRERLV